VTKALGNESNESSLKSEQSVSKLGLRLDSDGAKFDAQSVLSSLGGWLGIFESIVPGTAFVVLFTLTQSIFTAIIVGSALSLGFVARQIIMRRSLAQALVGIVTMGLAAYFALKPGGNPKDYFLPGLLTNLAYAVVLTVSILVRWPIVGVLAGFLTGDGLTWRSNKSLLRRFSAVTGIWVALFVLRLAIEIPLFLANQLATLGIAKLVLGMPMYALTIWMSWLGMRSAFQSKL
jgi:hypothetical protein